MESQVEAQMEAQKEAHTKAPIQLKMEASSNEEKWAFLKIGSLLRYFPVWIL